MAFVRRRRQPGSSRGGLLTDFGDTWFSVRPSSGAETTADANGPRAEWLRMRRDGDTLERWMSAMTALKQDSAEHGERSPVGDGPLLGPEAYTRWAKAYSDIVEAHGFTPQAFGRVTDAVVSAWAAINMTEQMRQKMQEMAQAREQIRQQPGLSDAQKERMLAQMDRMGEQMKRIEQAPDSDKALVREHRERLRELTENGHGA
jgi:hypothetical protein